MSTENTSLSLLEGAKAGSHESWERLDGIYRPFLRRWFRYRSIQDDIADDLTQQVLLAFSRELPNFEHSGRTGSLRSWLRQAAIFKEKGYWRNQQSREDAVGGTGFHVLLEELEDDDSTLAQYWDQQHDRFVLQKLLDDIAPKFEANTMTAFVRYTLDGESAQKVANELGMSVGSIYVAKSRVLQRLRAEAEGLVDDQDWS